MNSPLISEKVELNLHCNYKTGGRASYFAAPKNITELRDVLLWSASKGVKKEIIGGGCNLLISDGGYDGLIISTAFLNRFISRNGNIVSCGSGITLKEITCYSIENGLGGFENLAGIPGCVGGALKMNAGAFGLEMKDLALNINVMDGFGKEFTIPVDKAGFDYRKSTGLDGFIITGGEFSLKKENVANLENIKSDILKRRKEKQPLDKPSCGSVFKRPATGFAGAYIEECGLKGLRRGGAVISEKHANFILNFDNATSSDIKWLIDKVVETVLKEKGVELFPEVKFIGFES